MSYIFNIRKHLSLAKQVIVWTLITGVTNDIIYRSISEETELISLYKSSFSNAFKKEMV